MAAEIERKFLVRSSGWKTEIRSSHFIRQAYLASTSKSSIRLRIIDDTSALLTIKSAEPDIKRSEFEYSIPLQDAEEMLDLRSGLLIEKRRYIVPARDLNWEIDVFEGAYKDLVIAEIELPDADAQFEKPVWLGAEVTGDARYYNATLANGTSNII